MRIDAPVRPLHPQFYRETQQPIAYALCVFNKLKKQLALTSRSSSFRSVLPANPITTVRTKISMRFRAQDQSAQEQGFALIVTISMMILLALLAVGLLSLSTVSLRASNQGQALIEARSNARMAAMMAIGQLQDLTGLDTRVTASAKLVDDSNIEVAGVWRSWEGTNHDNNGMPIPPDYGSKNQAGDPSGFGGGRVE